MFDGTSNDVALRVFELAFILYVLAGGAVLLLVKGEDTLFKKLVSLPFLPTFVIWGLVLCCPSIPLYWLYPEKHMTTIDFEGTEKEKQKLREYRAILSRKSVWRRLAERLGLAQKADPPWPFTTK